MLYLSCSGGNAVEKDTGCELINNILTLNTLIWLLNYLRYHTQPMH